MPGTSRTGIAVRLCFFFFVFVHAVRVTERFQAFFTGGAGAGREVPEDSLIDRSLRRILEPIPEVVRGVAGRAEFLGKARASLLERRLGAVIEDDHRALIGQDVRGSRVPRLRGGGQQAHAGDGVFRHLFPRDLLHGERDPGILVAGLGCVLQQRDRLLDIHFCAETIGIQLGQRVLGGDEAGAFGFAQPREAVLELLLLQEKEAVEVLGSETPEFRPFPKKIFDRLLVAHELIDERQRIGSLAIPIIGYAIHQESRDGVQDLLPTGARAKFLHHAPCQQDGHVLGPQKVRAYAFQQIDRLCVVEGLCRILHTEASLVQDSREKNGAGHALGRQTVERDPPGERQGILLVRAAAFTRGCIAPGIEPPEILHEQPKGEARVEEIERSLNGGCHPIEPQPVEVVHDLLDIDFTVRRR